MIEFAEIPRRLRERYFWDWNDRARTHGILPWALIHELESKDVTEDAVDDEARIFLANITGDTFEYAGYSMDR